MRVKCLSSLLVLILLLSLLVVSCRNFAFQERGGTNDKALTQLGINRRFVLDAEFNKLLDKLQLLDGEKQIMVYIRSVVTDPKIGNEFLRTYTNLEFSNLLNALGSDKVKEIIKNHLKDCKKRPPVISETQALIGRFNRNDEVKRIFQSELNGNSNYALHLKELFSYDNPNYVYNEIMKDDCIDDLLEEIEEAQYILNYEALYAKLSLDDKKQLDSIRNVLINVPMSILRDTKKPLKVYDIYEFEILLGSMDVARSEEILRIHINVLKEEKNTQKALITAMEGQMKQSLFRRFIKHQGGYRMHLMDLFGPDKASPNKVYDAFKNSKYADEYIAIRNEALSIRVNKIR
ncbi:BTA121 domain-containing protein surface lipoprotein [Borrelia venezuelensis]|uniref:BTA121 domain-containing protein surface lipoprotein n=1 Tax=Borrelia venezuelensis TaxID=1653839 RepID=UPI001FF2EA53|nr:hypothetical protein [Borrelia venezuelensis]UPA12692.1 hypothetical protein bvRMA01_001027 [Borrelia venezuelensis]